MKNIEKTRRPSIDRPRYMYLPNPKLVGKDMVGASKVTAANKKQQLEMKDQQISGSVNPVVEDNKVDQSKDPSMKTEVRKRSNTTNDKKVSRKKPKSKRKSKVPVPERKPREPTSERKPKPPVKKDKGGVFKQMRDKFVGKPEDTEDSEQNN